MMGGAQIFGSPPAAKRRVGLCAKISNSLAGKISQSEGQEPRAPDLRGFLKRLRVKSLEVPLSAFWPPLGPVWDGLALSNRGDLILVEAKARCGEIASPRSRAKEGASTDLIHKSLNATRDYMGVTKDVNWSDKYYQYSNRLAHLYYLRVLNHLPAWLVFVCFENGKGENYADAIATMHEHLGIGRHRLEEWVVEVFLEER